MASRCWGVRRSNGAIGPVCRGGWRGTMAHRWHVSSSSRSVRSMVETIVGSRNHNRSMTTQPFGAIWPFNERRKHREHRHPNHHHHQQQLIERQQIERQPHSVLGVVHSDLLGANVYNRLQIQCNAATAATNRRCSSSSKRETVTNPEETSKSSTQRTMEMKDDTPVGVAESLIHKETHTNQNHRTQPIVEASSSDPPVWTWIDRFLPPPVQPYARLARLDKPIGTMLLVSPFRVFCFNFVWQ